MEPIIELKEIISIIVLGYFIYSLKKLNDRVLELGDVLHSLKSEHDTMKGLSKCPLVGSVEGAHSHIRKEDI